MVQIVADQSQLAQNQVDHLWTVFIYEGLQYEFISIFTENMSQIMLVNYYKLIGQAYIYYSGNVVFLMD